VASSGRAGGVRIFASCVAARSSALLALPVVAVVLVLHFALRDHAWRREWLWAFDTFAFSAMLTGPVLAGVAAWEGARWARCRTMLAVAERPGTAVAQYVGAMVGWVWALHAIAVACLVVIVAAGPVGTAPSLSELMLTLPLLALLAAEIAGGFAVGWWMRRGVVAPLAAVAVFVVTLYAYSSEPGLFVEIGGATASLLGLAPRSQVQIAQTAFWLAVATLATASASWACDRRRRGAQLAIGLAGGAALVAAGVILDLGTLRFHEVPVATDCRGDRPEICLADGYGDLRPVLTEQIAVMYASLDEAGVELPDRVAQSYSEADRGHRVMYLGAVTALTSVEMVAMVIGSIMPVDCDVFASPQSYQAYTDLAYWVARQLGESRDDPQVSPELTGDDTPLALDVVRARVNTLSMCTS
jgi:hypothetical protein